jgi:DNA polymerase-3 subunit alpha
MAYGYITYQTAYLKANFPVEYLAALLSSIAGDQDKVQRYLTDCGTLNIIIQPPDINRSERDFTPVGNEILFGLGAVKNVGEAVVDELIHERERSGSFTSLADLCSRVRLTNKRSLEALIKSGALDALHSNRNQMLSDLDPVVEWASSRLKDQEVGQASLFDLVSENTAQVNFASVPQGPLVNDFLPQDKLRYEKELLGFYISDHPLKSLRASAYLLAPANLANLSSSAEKQSISVLALLVEVKQVVTKKGDRMAILTLEDLTGSGEAVVFAKAYERIHQLLVPDSRLFLWGHTDRRDDRLQLIIEDAEPVEQVSMVVIDLDLPEAQDIHKQQELRIALKTQQSEEDSRTSVVARIHHLQQNRLVRFGPQFRVKDAQAAVYSLREKGFQAELKRLVSS